jgi:predicted nucleotidyltransferase
MKMKNNSKVRLTEEEIKIIKETAKKYFGENAKVYLFGSRTDLNKRGGDIDLFIETNKKTSLMDELNFLSELELKGIERKVDLIVKNPFKKDKNIYQEGKRGVLL